MKRVHLNALVDAVALIGFMCLASTGLILRFQLPPGSGELVGRGQGRGAAHRSIDLLWGLTRHEWGDVHYWCAVGLLVVLSLHLFLHWKWIVCVLRGTQPGASGWRFAIGLFAFVAVVLVVILPLVSDLTTTTREQLQRQRIEQNGTNSGKTETELQRWIDSRPEV